MARSQLCIYLVEEAFVVVCPGDGRKLDPLELIRKVLSSGYLHHLK